LLTSRTALTGSIDTLWNVPKEKGVDVREELLRFHKEHYSANLVTVTVLGR
jgi:insulysin